MTVSTVEKPSPALAWRSFGFRAFWITALALFLRIHGLDRESFFLDEIRQSAAYGLSLPDLAREAAHQNLPPLDYWLGHLVNLVWSSDFALRLPAALFGAGAVVLMMILARRAFSPGKALFAGAFFALLPFHIHFSQELRPYSSAIFFAVLALVIVERFFREGMGVLSSAGAYLAFLAFLLTRPEGPLVFLAVLSLAVAALALARRDATREQGTPSLKDRILLLSCAALAIASYLPFLRRIVAASPSYVSTGSGLFAGILPKMDKLSLSPLWTAFCVQADPLGPALFPLAVAGAVVALLGKGASRRPFMAACGAALLFAPLVHLLVWRLGAKSELQPGYLFYLMPLGVLLLLNLADSAAGLFENLFPGKARRLVAAAAAITLLALACSTVLYKTSRHREDWKGLCRHIEAAFPQGCVLLFDQVQPLAAFDHSFFGFPRYHRTDAARLSQDASPAREEIPLPPGYRPSTVFKSPVFRSFYNYRGFFDLQFLPPDLVYADPARGPMISLRMLPSIDPWIRDQIHWQDRLLTSGFGKATHVSLFPFVPLSEGVLGKEPAIILYCQQEKYLTQVSMYPYRKTDYARGADRALLEGNPAIKVVAFREFHLVRLARPTGELARDVLALLQAILPALPDDTSRVDALLTTAHLEKRLGTGAWDRRVLQLLDIAKKEVFDCNELEELYDQYI